MKKTLIVRKSGIQGRGLYALVPFRKGQNVLEYTGPILTEEQIVRLNARRKHCWFQEIEDGRTIDGKNCIGRFVNHSCVPNVVIVHHGLTNFFEAKRSIAVGEEILLDYSFDTAGEELYPCQCGASKCRGYINRPSDIKLYRKKNKCKTAAASSR